MPGYSCEQSTCNCVFAMFGAQYTGANAQQDCWSDPANCCMQSPPTCETQPTLSCWICLHYPGGQCIDFNTYFTYGSGAPGMAPTQTFLMTSVIGPDSNGIYTSHQGGAIYDSEADCVQQSGCEPFTPVPPPPVSPVNPKFEPSDLEYDMEREVSSGSGFVTPQGGSDRLKKFEKRQMKESDLTRLIRRVIRQ